MALTAPASGQVDYPREGYSVVWSPKGLEIRTTDYHCTELRLSWDELMDLARRSGWQPGSSR